jgi:predicted lipoprotein with Yx(FWY)xxD motif
MRPSSRLALLAGLAAGAALIAGACTSAAATPTVPAAPAAPAAATSITIGTANSPTLGAYLTGQNGMTLYVLTKDAPDTSTCSGACATNWPPLVVAGGATITGPSGAMSTFATITRSDGTVQVTYNHMPLYYYAGDSAAGDTTGQGINGVWFVAPLSGSLASAAPSAGAEAPSAAMTPEASATQTDAPAGY